MRKHLLFIAILVAVLGACQDDAVKGLSFADLQLTEAKSKIEVGYYTSAGVKIEKASQLLPNTEYTLKISSSVPISLMFRLTDGFIMAPVSADFTNVRQEHSYQIRTGENEVKDFFFSAVPIRKNGEGNYMKERPQLFLTSLEEE